MSETPFTDSEDFPPTEDKELTVTLWYGPKGKFQGPIGRSFGDGPIQADVSVSNLFDPDPPA